MSVLTQLKFDTLQKARRLVRKEHMRTFGVELPEKQIDQFIESYWNDFFEEQLKKAVDEQKV
ncbi:MAG: hypothetical protein VW498_02080 [Candidatus Thalassarchaeaceae archaeon]